MLEVQNRDGAVVMLWHPSPRLALPAPQSVPSQPTFLKKLSYLLFSMFPPLFQFVFFFPECDICGHLTFRAHFLLLSLCMCLR